jgi:hypothetical protein
VAFNPSNDKHVWITCRNAVLLPGKHTSPSTYFYGFSVCPLSEH